jgi:prepilin-type N-terminal cleavage/methylation domain-containing protein
MRCGTVYRMRIEEKQKGNAGVTLVEVLISLVILLIVFMGLLQASIMSIDHNLRNSVRDEAVRLGSEYMTRTRSLPFASLTATLANCSSANWGTLALTNRNFRNMTQPYLIYRCIEDLDTDNKRIGINVRWTYRSDNLTHRIFTSVRNK